MKPGEQQSKTDDITLFAAASTIDIMNEVISSFEKETNVKILTNYASSSTLAQQISQGAEADIFLSANLKWVDFLEQKGMIDKRINLLGNKLVAVLPANSSITIGQVTDLLQDSIKNIAMGEPESVPAGIYAKQAFTALQLWQPVKKKMISGIDVRQVLVYVEREEVQAGIVYKTDALQSRKVKVALEFSTDLTGKIVYPLALIKREHPSDQALAFYQYLNASKMKELYKKFGFIVD